MTVFDQTFTIDDVQFRVTVIDERPDMDLDPTLAIYRGDEDEPVATVHLDHEAACYEPTHIVVREPDIRAEIETLEEAARATDIHTKREIEWFRAEADRLRATIDEDEPDDGKTLIAGVLYDNETGWEADPQ